MKKYAITWWPYDARSFFLALSLPLTDCLGLSIARSSLLSLAQRLPFYPIWAPHHHRARTPKTSIQCSQWRRYASTEKKNKHASDRKIRSKLFKNWRRLRSTTTTTMFARCQKQHNIVLLHDASAKGFHYQPGEESSKALQITSISGWQTACFEYCWLVVWSAHGKSNLTNA